MRRDRQSIPKPRPDWLAPALTVCLCFTAMMTAVAMFTGQWAFRLHYYYSYELQAQAWLQGSLSIPQGEFYDWLQLAIRDGKYYVSFPPFPSYVLLPFVALGGIMISDGVLAWLVAMLGCVYTVRLYMAVTGSERGVYLFSLPLLLGNGYLFLTMNAWVWFIAQNMCFALTMMALYYAWQGRGGLSLAAWACSVGCRPMAVLWFPVLAYLLYREARSRDPETTLLRLMLKKCTWAIAPVLIASSYMVLNQLRFGSILEFGHNYLPEFTRQAEGQFDLSYLLPNLMQYLTPPAWQGIQESLSFMGVDGTAFWLVNPMLVLTGGAWLCAVIRRRQKDRFLLITMPVLLVLYFLLICLHRTLGGVQFGNRYLVDLLPAAFLGVLLWKPRRQAYDRIWLIYGMFGTAVNLIGTLCVYNNLI